MNKRKRRVEQTISITLDEFYERWDKTNILLERIARALERTEEQDNDKKLFRRQRIW